MNARWAWTLGVLGLGAGVHCGGRIDGQNPCGPTEEGNPCVASCGSRAVSIVCGACPAGTIPLASCSEPQPQPPPEPEPTPRPPGSEQCPWAGARDGDRCDAWSEGVTCLAAPLACADGTTLQTASCTCYGGRFMCSPEPPSCCPAPYHLRTDAQDGERCVWSCGAGTQPDMTTLQCECQAGKVEAGKDPFGRRVCK